LSQNADYWFITVIFLLHNASFFKRPLSLLQLDRKNGGRSKTTPFVVIDRTRKPTYAELHQKAGTIESAQFLRHLEEASSISSDGQRHLVHSSGAG
ncbi:MAG: hypothetical protein LBS40_02965, partial [Burkholderiales bacterium]|nr:hypothetical protein [Burkholderiales bacterium]